MGLIAWSGPAIASRCAAADGWTDIRVAGPFVCRADFRLDDLQPLFADLSQLQNDLVESLQIPRAEDYIELYLFHNEWTYRQYLSQYLPRVPYRRALYLKSGGPGVVLAYRSRELEVDLRHECTHALLHAALPMVPLWLDEGLAEYFELRPAQRAYDNSYLPLVRWNCRWGIVPKMQSLEKKGDLAEMGVWEYRASWAWMHFCLHGPADARNELIRFLDDIKHNSPPGQLSERLARRIPDLDRCFVKHFLAWSR